MDLWTALLDILILLTAAMVLGGIFERLGQSPILGYLLAGTLLGPKALDLLPSHAAVATIAELGVALLLFTIGLEFSWRRLQAVGPLAFAGGTLQVLLTGGLTAALGLTLGLGGRASLALGGMIALSSTAAVVRLLNKRAEIDAIHGRNAVGILLLQDIAVVPLVLMVTTLSGEGSALDFAIAMGRALALAALLVGALHLLLNRVVPLLLTTRTAAGNRDVPILLAVITSVGAAWASHTLGFSPVLGAFIAGMLLAESPFATQIRADIVPLQTLFVTLFFSSIGMLSNPAWMLANWGLLLAVVAAIIVGKAVITSGIAVLFRCPVGPAVATGVILAQVGEFSVVLATAARAEQVIGVELFELILAALTVTLFLTPFLMDLGPRLATVIGNLLPAGIRFAEAGGEQHGDTVTGHLVIVGFGPAGQRVAEALMGEQEHPVLVVDLNPSSAELARSYGLPTLIGDATREEILERLHVRNAAAVVVTLPDPGSARQVVQRVRALSPDAVIIVRSRYHVHRWQLELAGAHAVVDEEAEVGLRMATEVRSQLNDLTRPPESNESPG